MYIVIWFNKLTTLYIHVHISLSCPWQISLSWNYISVCLYVWSLPAFLCFYPNNGQMTFKLKKVNFQGQGPADSWPWSQYGGHRKLGNYAGWGGGSPFIAVWPFWHWTSVWSGHFCDFETYSYTPNRNLEWWHYISHTPQEHTYNI